MKDDTKPMHQSLLPPADNKFHVGNGEDGKHYWLTPPELLSQLAAEHGPFDFDPCPFPKPEAFDGLTCEWGECSYVNPPFGSILHQGPDDKKPKKKGPTAWVRKAITEAEKGKRVVLVYPVDKWLLMLLAAGAKVSNLGDVRWHATEDGSVGKGTGRHIACFVLDGAKEASNLKYLVFVPGCKPLGPIWAKNTAEAMEAAAAMLGLPSLPKDTAVQRIPSHGE